MEETANLAESCSDWRDSSDAAGKTWPAIAPVSSDARATPDMLLVTSGAFAKLKASSRAQAARSVADLCDTLKQAFGRFTPSKCRNRLVAASYDAFDLT